MNINQHKKHITYHNQDLRKHYRLSNPLLLLIEGKNYQTKDWSIGGLAINNFHRPLNSAENLNLTIIIKLKNFSIDLDVETKVVASDQDYNIRLVFFNLSERSKNVLKFFSERLISGETENIEEEIKKIINPVESRISTDKKYYNYSKVLLLGAIVIFCCFGLLWLK